MRLLKRKKDAEREKEMLVYLEIADGVASLERETRGDRQLTSRDARERISASMPYGERAAKAYKRIEEVGDSSLTRLFREVLRGVEQRLGYGVRRGNSAAASRMVRLSRYMLAPGYINKRGAD